MTLKIYNLLYRVLFVTYTSKYTLYILCVVDGATVTDMYRLQHSEQQMRDLQRKMQEMEDTLNCSICLENVKSVAFLCGHSACTQCSQPLKVCHMCRKPITKKINLFT